MRSVRSIIIKWHTQAFQLTRTVHAILLISHCVPIFCMRRTYRYILTQESPVSYLDSIHTWNHTTVYTKLLHNLSMPKNTYMSCLKVNTSTQICWNKIQYTFRSLGFCVCLGNFILDICTEAEAMNWRVRQLSRYAQDRGGGKGARHTTTHIYHFERFLPETTNILCNLNDNSNKAHRICKGRNTKVILLNYNGCGTESSQIVKPSLNRAAKTLLGHIAGASRLLIACQHLYSTLHLTAPSSAEKIGAHNSCLHWANYKNE